MENAFHIVTRDVCSPEKLNPRLALLQLRLQMSKVQNVPMRWAQCAELGSLQDGPSGTWDNDIARLGQQSATSTRPREMVRCQSSLES